MDQWHIRLDGPALYLADLQYRAICVKSRQIVKTHLRVPPWNLTYSFVRLQGAPLAAPRRHHSKTEEIKVLKGEGEIYATPKSAWKKSPGVEEEKN